MNSLFYAADMDTAMGELVRVVRPGGRVGVTAWGPPERCEFLAAVMPALGPLMPPPPPSAPPPHPGALSEPGALAAGLKRAGLRVVEQGEVAYPFVFPSTEEFSSSFLQSGYSLYVDYEPLFMKYFVEENGTPITSYSHYLGLID